MQIANAVIYSFFHCEILLQIASRRVASRGCRSKLSRLGLAESRLPLLPVLAGLDFAAVTTDSAASVKHGNKVTRLVSPTSLGKGGVCVGRKGSLRDEREFRQYRGVPLNDVFLKKMLVLWKM